MNGNQDGGLVSPSDIAEIAGVTRGAVSNWRKRNATFPAPASGTPGKPLFLKAAVLEWLEGQSGRAKKSSTSAPVVDTAQMDLWSTLNRFRGEVSHESVSQLLLSLAVARKAGANPTQVPGVPKAMWLAVKDAIDGVDVAELATATDFALERLSRARGKLGADLGFVGSRTSTLLASLAAAQSGGVLYDPACGIATALLNAVTLGAKPTRIVGHDVSSEALEIAAQRAALLNVEIEFTETDVMSIDVDPDLRADVVLLEPPFGSRLEASRRLTDARFEFGLPPRSSADMAWIQHAIAHLAPEGRAYVLTPATALYRGGEEARIRAELLKHGCIEAIVGLPGKLLPQTSIALALWVLRRPATEQAAEQVLMIDASGVESPESNVATWLNDPRAREGVPHVEVSITDILVADFALSPQRWVNRADPDPDELGAEYHRRWSAIGDAVHRLQRDSESFEHPSKLSKSRVMTIGELIDEGVLEFQIGRLRTARADGASEAQKSRLITVKDLRTNTFPEKGNDVADDDKSALTLEGDVLVSTTDRVIARVDQVGGHALSVGIHLLRIKNHEVMSPNYLAAALEGNWNERFRVGAGVSRAPIKHLEVPLVPVTEQREIEVAIQTANLLRDEALALADNAGAVSATLLGSVRYNVPIASPDAAQE